MKPFLNQIWAFRSLQFASISVLLAYGIQHLFFETPYRVLLWDEALMKPFLEKIFHIDWYSFVTDIRIDEWVNHFTNLLGILLIIAAVACFYIDKINKKIVKYVLFLASFLILFVVLLWWKDQGFLMPKLLEYTCQWSVCILLYMFISNVKNINILFYIKLAIALTFIGHGLFAMNIYPMPSHFSQMTMKMLNCSEQNAYAILYIMGILDVLAALMLFLPPKYNKYALYYCIFWGFATSFARFLGNFYTEMALHTLYNWTHEFLKRAPHFFMPLAALFLQNIFSKKSV